IRSFFFRPDFRMDVNVVDIQKSRLFESDVDEGGLHSGQYASHAALVDISDDPLALSTLDQDFLDLPAFHKSDSRLGKRGVHDEFCRHNFLRTICRHEDGVCETAESERMKFQTVSKRARKRRHTSPASHDFFAVDSDVGKPEL